MRDLYCLSWGPSPVWHRARIRWVSNIKKGVTPYVECAALVTKNSAACTECAGIECAAADTECAAARNECAAARNECATAHTDCAAARTDCAAARTECAAARTECAAALDFFHNSLHG